MNNEIIWVTGASSGIGRATVEKFAGAGAKVLAIARRQDRLQQLEEAFPGQVLGLAIDLTDQAQLSRRLEELASPWNEPLVLVNNAGAALGLEPAQNCRWQDWQAMLDLNLKSLLFLSHWVLPGMCQRQRGHLIQIGSVAGTYPYRGGQVYGASKAFVEQFSLGLRCDLLGLPIRVSNIEPGAVETEFSLVRFQGDHQRAAQVYQGFQPLSSQDIAATIYWCATQPAHVNINRIELMPVMQAPAGFAWHRQSID